MSDDDVVVDRWGEMWAWVDDDDTGGYWAWVGRLDG
jgi:hypothetical protein